MKTSLLAAMLAATALLPAPAIAQERGDGGMRHVRAQDGQARPGRDVARPAPSGQAPQRQWNGERATRGEWRRPQATPQAQPQQQQSAPDWQRRERPRPDYGARGPDGQRRPIEQRQQWQRAERDRDDRNRTGWNDRPPREWNDQDRRDWNDRDRRDWNDRDRRDWNDRNRRDWNDRNRWDHDRNRWNDRWRNDRRYDWRSYRTSHRHLYRLPRYYAPPGWGYGYRRFTIGFRLNTLLYSSRYWINDPFYYRLPAVYGPYRWVRYYNDALLVDIYTGQVVDVIHDIFW